MAYYQSMQLAKPVFLKHYIEINGNQSERIELRFIQNIKAGKKVSAIQIEEFPMLRFALHSQQNEYKYQTQGSAYAEWEREEDAASKRAPITIREVTVYYNDGESERVPIGEIRIVWDRDSGVLRTASGGASSDGSGFDNVTVEKPVTLEQIDYSFSEKLGDHFELKASSAEEPSLQLPSKLDTGDMLMINYQWRIADDSPDAFGYYQIRIDFKFRTEEGQAGYGSIPVSYNYTLSENQIKRLVRSGGELP